MAEVAPPPRVPSWYVLRPRRLAAQALVLAVLATWPALPRLWSEAVGSYQSDTPKHLWTLWWMRAEALGGTPGLQTGLVNFPDGMPLYPIEPLHGLFALLVPIPAVALSNVLAILHVFLTGLCAGWLGWLVTRRPAGAHVAGALAQGCTFTAFTLHVGVGELRQFWWIPLGLALLVKASETLRAKWFAALGGVLAAATLSCFYHGFFLALAVAVVAVATLRPHPRLLLGYAGAAALSLVVVVPVARLFAATYAPADTASQLGFLDWMSVAFPIETHPGSSLELSQLVTPREVPFTEANRQVYAYGGGRYLGWIALLLAGAGVVAAPRKAYPWVLVALAGTVLAMGTVLWRDGAVVVPHVVLPLTWLNRALAFLAEPLNFPVRFLALPMVSLCVLGALAAARWRWGWVLAPLAIVDMNVNDIIPWPRDTFALPTLAPVVAPPGGVADLTFATRADGGRGAGGGRARGGGGGRRRGAQVSLGRPIQTMPVERVDRWGQASLRWTAALPLAGAVHGDAVSADDLRASVALLRARGFGSVLVTHPCGRPDAAPAVLGSVLGAPAQGACGRLWTLPDTPATPDEIAAWEAGQETRIAGLPRYNQGPAAAPGSAGGSPRGAGAR